MAKRILVAPLDWGLGHATRCIPIVQELLEQGAEVILASNGRAFELLKKEFPEIPIEKLPAYDIWYRSGNMFWNIGLQLPKIAIAIWQEHRVLKTLIAKHRIDAVISDNRYGCFSRNVKSVFVTHQLNILIPNFLLQKMVNRINRQLIRRFDECWIPDINGTDNLSGDLTKSSTAIPTKFIGVLSRMKLLNVPKKYDVAIVLSGPEPQRTLLEELIVAQAKSLPFQFLVVQGKTEVFLEFQAAQNIHIISFLTGEALNQVLAVAGIVICRSGYSSVMDLAMLGKKAIFVPTPGQTEQEYLAKRFFEKGIFFYQKQRELNLSEALEKVQQFSGLNNETYIISQQVLKKIIQDFSETF